MRVLLKATLDTEKSNEVIRSGKMESLIKETIDHIKPEGPPTSAPSADGARP